MSLKRFDDIDVNISSQHVELVMMLLLCTEKNFAGGSDISQSKNIFVEKRNKVCKPPPTDC